MAKFTVQNQSVTTQGPNKQLISNKVGTELELSPEMAKKMDPEGFYLCPSSKYRKGKTYTPKAGSPDARAIVEEEEEADEPDEDELEKLTKPSWPAK